MATIHNESFLAKLNQTLKAKVGHEYVQLTGVGKGTMYRGQLDGTLKWVTDNFDVNAQNAVIAITGSSSTATTSTTASTPTTPGSITTGVNQMNLSDVLAFAAAN